VHVDLHDDDDLVGGLRRVIDDVLASETSDERGLALNPITRA
jgi:hypothetical protein